MRFVIAIVLFVTAFVSIGLGVAQRTVFRGPDHLTAAVDVTGGVPFVVIDGATLNANPGAQLVEVSGGSGPVFMAYGRTDDVDAWLTGERVARLGYDAATSRLAVARSAEGEGTSTPHPAPSTSATPGEDEATEDGAAADEGTADEASEAATAETSASSPVGSDLWIQEFEGDGTLVRKINVPSDVSVLIATDGTAAAPPRVSVTWPLDNSTPWSGPLIVGGIGALLLGLASLVWALLHARRRNGPRRKTPRMPKPPRPAQLKPAPRRAALTPGAPGAPEASRGRRRAFVALPVLLVGALALSACSEGASAPAAAPESSATPTVEIDPPVVTKQQFTRIVARAVEAIAQADEGRDATLAATRLAGPALELRTANYTARGADSAIAALPAAPAGEIGLVLPQQQHQWPRVVFAAVSGADGAEYGLMFVQETPREQYKVHYLIRLTQSIPEVAPIDLGAAPYDPDSKLLAEKPAQLAAEYGDVLIAGDESPFADLFDATDDRLRSSLGADYKAQRRAELPNAVVNFASAAGTEAPVALATNDTGAIVAVDLRETETVTPAEQGAAINPKGAVKALSGKTTTTKGIAAQYGMQVLFYVPPATAKDAKVRVLGFTQGLIAASEVA